MDFNPLKPGKTYKEDKDGNLVEVNPPMTLTPVPDDDLPPDMRANAKIDEIAENIKKVSAALQTKAEPPEPVVELSQQDKEAFFRAVISNRPYKKSFSAFNGKIKFTFKTLTTAEMDSISDAVVTQSSRVPYSSMLAMAGAHMRFAMTVSLTEIRYDNEDGITINGYPDVVAMYEDGPKKDTYYVRDANGIMQKKDATVLGTAGQKVIWAAVDKFAPISVPLYNVIFDHYQKFDLEVVRMTREAANPDFFLNGADGPYSS